ncbi:hypothetical protein D9757_012693 [Collybiopsis confluens]|uniref:DUF6534 domain-containing protein n=1 Tax=Collybiopsis confluens TaxID=2823264 RepID=A0A8H5GJZ1_9AGAR|nr:hypothetical protein D9757_012693 [Collybiopsis confluens]
MYVILALLQIAAGITQTVKITKAITSLEAAASVACDIVITLALFIKLRSHHSTIKSTNTVLQKLSLYAINRGILTAVSATLNLILAQKHTQGWQSIPLENLSGSTAASNPRILANSTRGVNIDTVTDVHFDESGLNHKTSLMPDMA